MRICDADVEIQPKPINIVMLLDSIHIRVNLKLFWYRYLFVKETIPFEFSKMIRVSLSCSFNINS